MRRIPRPSRVADSLHTPAQLLPLSSRRPSVLCNHLKTSAAALSTSSSRAFLLPGKQDKKKHQQFVRRWQKRLLGDSEPIGAHVDPYDPTSPVRIAPEEQGEYEEILEEDEHGVNAGGSKRLRPYEPATYGRGLLRIGGKQWGQQRLEQELAKEFEKLTLRTYTPLSLDMANHIEDLTGTPYTLRDENLMMAQTTHHVTARPYTMHNFGMYTKSKSAKEVRRRFSQAVAEVYALKQAGLETDLSKFPNRGIYKPPGWLKDVTLSRDSSGKIVLQVPGNHRISHLLELIQSTPAWNFSSLQDQTLAEEELIVEEGDQSPEPAVSQEPQPPIDADTPAFKRAALVKTDGDNNSFDFMSNRPVPRKQHEFETPREKKSHEAPLSTGAMPSPIALTLAELDSAASNSQLMLGEIRRSYIEQRAKILAQDFKTIKTTVLSAGPRSFLLPTNSVKWSEVKVEDSIKFALFKRLLQLTGRRISDSDITAARTLGDLYDFLCAAAKPQPSSLFTTLHTEGQRAREKTKRQDATPKRRADLGDLITLGNVKLHRVKPTKSERRSKTGLQKVVQYALWERGLTKGTLAKPKQRRRTKRAVQEGTRKVPNFGKVVSSHTLEYLLGSKSSRTVSTSK